MKNYLLLTAAAFAVFISNTAIATTSCTGDACNDIIFEWKNSCHVTTNTGSKSVRVHQGPYKFVLSRGAKNTLKGSDGKCVTTYVGGNQAWYSGGVGEIGPNIGQQCSAGPISTGIQDQEELNKLDANCNSGFCYPGPTAGTYTAEWYCTARSSNCSWPGSSGGHYGDEKKWKSTTVTCRDPENGNRARFSN